VCFICFQFYLFNAINEAFMYFTPSHLFVYISLCIELYYYSVFNPYKVNETFVFKMIFSPWKFVSILYSHKANYV
jgi:hypothetical protein